MIDILNGMCERCLMKGLIQSLDDARKIYDVFDRFRNNGYVRDDEYSDDILYFYNLATKLHKSGNTSLEESYSIYNAILAADMIDFVETDVNSDIENISEENIVKVEPVKRKRSKSSHSEKVKFEDVGVIDISDISL